MQNYVIYTDSACDLTEETLKEWGVQYTCLTFKFDDDDKEYSNYDLSAKEFYEQMQQGRTAKTSATNVDTFKKAFEPILKGYSLCRIFFRTQHNSKLRKNCCAGA